MDINEMYKIVQYAVNKSQNGYVSPSQFNLLINQAQIDYQDFLLGQFQQYQYGKAAPRISYTKNEDIRQRMTPFINEATLSTDASGYVAYPVGYLQTDTIRTSNFKRVRFVQQDSLYSYFNSQIDPIITNPIYLLEKEGFRFYPNISTNSVALTNLKLTYVKVANTVSWGYSLDANGRPVFAPAGQVSPTPVVQTVEPLWYDVDKLEIITRILKLVGLNLQDGAVQQYANQIITQGQ